MKKIFLVLVILVLAIGCSSDKKMTEVTASQLIEKFDKKESFVFVVASTTCAACLEARPVFEEIVAKKGVDILIWEIDKEVRDGDKVNEEGKERMNKVFTTYLEDKVNSTPTLVVVKDGKLVNLKAGLAQYIQYLDFLGANNVIENK